MKNENAQGQVLEFGAAVLKALPRDIDSVTMQGWIENPKGLNKFLKDLCSPDVAKKYGPYLRLLKVGLVIDPCDGTDIIPGSNDMFEAGIDSDFVRWAASEPFHQPTGETLVDVYELIDNANSNHFFYSLGSIKNLCLTQAQIKGFVKKHRQWLMTDGYATLFPFELHNKVFQKFFQFVVAYVKMDSAGRLRVDMSKFESSGVWSVGGRTRVVVLQLA